jgi:hypothetical protein
MLPVSNACAPPSRNWQETSSAFALLFVRLLRDGRAEIRVAERNQREREMALDQD